MTTIDKITDLTAATVESVDWDANGWETSAANCANVVIYTYNAGAAYSIYGGDTFHVIGANGLCAAHGKALAGDQVVIFIPSINQFAWVLLTTDQSLVLAMATPTEVQESLGTTWVTLLITPSNFEDGTQLFDRPTISAGHNHLYIAVDLSPTPIFISLSLAELVSGGSINIFYYLTDGVWWLRAAQNTGSTGYFAALTYVAAPDGQQYISNMRVFWLPEGANQCAYFDVPIASVPTEGGTVSTPQGDWLSNGKGSLQVLGLTVSGNELWAAWWGNLTLLNPPPDGSGPNFPYPHIEIAVVDLETRQLKTQYYIWSSDFAFVFSGFGHQRKR